MNHSERVAEAHRIASQQLDTINDDLVYESLTEDDSYEDYEAVVYLIRTATVVINSDGDE